MSRSGRSKANPRSKNGNTRRKIRAKWKAIGAPCALCGKQIDYSLGFVFDPRTGKKRMHPMAFVVDEIVPVALGGNPLDFANTQPTHWICNARKGDGRKHRAQPKTEELPLPQPWDI